MNRFCKGFVTGAAALLALVLIITAYRFFYERDRNLFEYVEKHNALQEMREDYDARDPYEFLDTPGVRGAVDSAIDRFREQRREILQRRGSDGDY